MRYFDVFNGDADGICALHQLRLADPVDSTLVTGLKRDIALLARVAARTGDVVTVLDVALDRNREALMALLERGAVVRYFDHHHTRDIPRHPLLDAVIDPSGEQCTSALIDRHLRGRFRAWAVVGAYGDNLPAVGQRLAAALGLDAERENALRDLGESLNYNAYGLREADVLVPPVALYRMVSHYTDPFEMAAREPLVERLAAERRADLDRALGTPPLRASEHAAAFVLPDAPWSRRVIGTFANRLAQAHPERAHAVLAPGEAGSYTVSVRAPRGRGPTAAEFCCRFPAGGGRTAAGGIEHLDSARIERFVEDFAQAWS